MMTLWWQKSPHIVGYLILKTSVNYKLEVPMNNIYNNIYSSHAEFKVLNCDKHL